MKILSASQTRALDAYTIQNEPISSIDLMERASKAFVTSLFSHIPSHSTVYIFCGLGNNGGDGLAVARLLIEKGISVNVFVIRYAKKTSTDFAINYQKFQNIATIHEIYQTTDFPEIKPDSILIDALFGSGLSRPLEGLCAEIVDYLNLQKNNATFISIDIPSGLMTDSVSIGSSIIRADKTITFQLPKLAFLLPENAPFVGNWEVVEIGLDATFIQNTVTPYHYLTHQFVSKIRKKRLKFSHKGTYGHALLLVGSMGKIGAAVLASKACLRSGVGLLTVHIPQCGYEILQTSLPEAMASVDENKTHITQLPEIQKYSAIGVGCGIDTQKLTVEVIKELFLKSSMPLILDADALNILAQNRSLLEILPKNSILTPHPKEFERLTRKAENHFERLEVLQNFAQVYQVFILLKGANTVIATPQGNVFFNSTGNPGMATAGSGDVLTGVLTGLLAQGYSPEETAILGVFLHGLAGDTALNFQTQESLMASDLIENLGKAWEYISFRD